MVLNLFSILYVQISLIRFIVTNINFKLKQKNREISQFCPRSRWKYAFN